MANDIVLANGTMVSGSMSLGPRRPAMSARARLTAIEEKQMHFMLNVRTVALACAVLMTGVTQSYANCDNGSLSGVYPFVANGFTVGIYDSSGVLQRLTPPQPLSSVGQFTFDGQGTFTRVDFNVGNGVPANNASTPVNESGFRIGQTGTYSISEDCTGRLALSVSGALIQYQLVVVDFGESARAIIASEHVPGFPNPPPGTDCSAGCDEGVNILVDLKKDVYRRSR